MEFLSQITKQDILFRKTSTVGNFVEKTSSVMMKPVTKLTE